MNTSNTNPYLKAAIGYHALGANIIAMRGGKNPLNTWKTWQTKRQTLNEVLSLKTSKAKAWAWKYATRVGVINGDVGGWRAFDLDKCMSLDAVYAILDKLGLPKDYRWVVRSGSGKGYHIWIRCTEPLPSGVLVPNKKKPGVFWGIPRIAGQFDHMELRYEKCQTVLPPSKHNSGGTYEWLNGEPTEPPAEVSAAQVIAAFLAIAEPGRPDDDEDKPKTKQSRQQKSPKKGHKRDRTFTPRLTNRRVIDALSSVLLARPEASISADNEWVSCCCPKHNDTKPSFGLNLLTGVGNCFGGCGPISPKEMCELLYINPDDYGGLYESDGEAQGAAKSRLRAVDAQPSEPPKEQSYKTLEDIRAEMGAVIEDYLAEKWVEPRSLLLQTPPGAGKNYAVMQAVRKHIANGQQVLILTYRTIKDKDKNQYLRELGAEDLAKKTLIIKGRSADPKSKGFCRRKAEDEGLMTALGQKGFSTQRIACKKCPYKEACRKKGYQKQFRKAKRFPLVIANYKHAYHPKLINERNLIVFDESPLQTIAHPQTYTSKDLTVEQCDVLGEKGLPTDLVKLVNGIRYVIEQPHEETLTGKAFFTALSEAVGGDGVLDELIAAVEPLELIEKPDLSKGVKALTTRLKPLIEVLSYETEAFLNEMPAWNSRVFLEDNKLSVYPMHPFAFSPATHVIVCDASGSPTQYQKAFRAGKTEHDPFFEVQVYDPQLQPKARVIQITDSEFTRATMEPDDKAEKERILEFAKRVIQVAVERHTNNVVVIGYKSTMASLKNWANRKMHIPLKNLAYFGNQRGRNDWKDCDAMVIIGTPRDNVANALRLAQVWHYADPDPLSFEQTSIDLPCQGYVDPVDGKGRTWNTHGYVDPRVNDFVHHFTRSELLQAKGRLREYDAQTPKTVYIVTAYPFAERVDDLISHRVFDVDIQVEHYTLDRVGSPIVTQTEIIQHFAREKGVNGKQEGRYSDKTVTASIKRVWAKLEAQGLIERTAPVTNPMGGRPTPAVRVLAVTSAEVLQQEQYAETRRYDWREVFGRSLNICRGGSSENPNGERRARGTQGGAAPRQHSSPTQSASDHTLIELFNRGCWASPRRR